MFPHLINGKISNLIRFLKKVNQYTHKFYKDKIYEL